jgi:hypothetical protein
VADVWVPQSWAGAVAPLSESDWHAWFARYGSAVERMARIAAEENASSVQAPASAATGDAANRCQEASPIASPRAHPIANPIANLFGSG